MSIPYVFQAMRPQDVTQVPYKTYKRYYLDSNTLTDTSSGYKIWSAVHSNKPVPVSAPQAQNDPTNSFDGSYQHSQWSQIDAQYYRFPYDPTRTLEHANKRFTYKFLNFSASILTLPHLDYGEMIKPGSVELTHSNFTLSDDKNGNLYDVSIDTGSFVPRQNLVAYWGFNNVFRAFRYREGSNSYGRLDYQSNVYEVDRNSYVNNIDFNHGVDVGGNLSGMAASFQGSNNSYILTEHKDEFNLDDFTISFWLKTNNSSSNWSIISKNSIVEKMTYGDQLKYQNDIQVSTLFVSRSFISETTSIYPYKVDIENGVVYSRFSNGITTYTISGSNVANNQWNHICITKDGNVVKLYQNATLMNQKTAKLNSTFNKHTLVFGRGFSGSLDEVRIYEIAATQDQVNTLANKTNQSLYQTAICGNAFYRSGKVVVSGFNSKYHNTFNSGSWTMKYRGTHTIYQNEALVRIAPGDFNLSQNPTVRQSYKSDLLINEMTTGSMMPYVTEIGFYNERGDLLVIGKPNQPIAMRDDTPINIITQFDY